MTGLVRCASAGALLPLLLAACVSDRPADSSPKIGANRLLEQARDADVVIRRGDVVGVDPRSDVVLRFASEEPAASEESVAKANAALEEAVRLSTRQREIVELFASLDPADAGALEQAQQESSDYNESTSKFFEVLLADPAVSQQKLMREVGLDGGFPGLVAYLERRFDREAAALAARRERAEWKVTVRASLSRKGEETKFLHVPHYDTLSEDVAKSRFSGFLGISRSELENLSSDLRRLEATAALLRQVRAEAASGRNILSSLAKQLGEEAERWLARVSANPGKTVEDLITKLGNLPADSTAEQQAAAQKATETLQRWKVGFETVAAVAPSFEALRDALTTRASAPASLSSLFDTGGELANAFKAVQAALESIETLAQSARTDLAILAQELPAALGGSYDDLLPPEIQAVFADLGRQFPATLQLLGQLAALLPSGAANGAATDSLAITGRPAPTVDQTIFQTLGSAPDARIRLSNTDIDEGDRVQIEAIAYPAGQQPGSGGAVAEPLIETWDLEAKRFGFFPRITAELIFARSDSGPGSAKDWKANVAAVADAHYRFRDPSTAGELWNLLDPALGVHLASLDQGDENVEFGMGVNVSFFGGFVTGGYGWNLVAEDAGEYYFLGIDLLKVLNDADNALN